MNLDINCSDSHSQENTLVNIFKAYCITFMNRLEDFKNDYVSKENSRKLDIFRTDFED